MKASFFYIPWQWLFFLSWINTIKITNCILCIYFSNGSIGFADHVERVLFTVCVDDRQPPPKTFLTQEKPCVSSGNIVFGICLSNAIIYEEPRSFFYIHSSQHLVVLGSCRHPSCLYGIVRAFLAWQTKSVCPKLVFMSLKMPVLSLSLL